MESLSIEQIASLVAELNPNGVKKHMLKLLRKYKNVNNNIYTILYNIRSSSAKDLSVIGDSIVEVEEEHRVFKVKKQIQSFSKAIGV